MNCSVEKKKIDCQHYLYLRGKTAMGRAPSTVRLRSDAAHLAAGWAQRCLAAPEACGWEAVLRGRIGGVSSRGRGTAGRVSALVDALHVGEAGRPTSIERKPVLSLRVTR